MLLWTLYLYNDAMDLCLWLEAYLGRAKFQLTQGKKECCFRLTIKKFKTIAKRKTKILKPLVYVIVCKFKKHFSAPQWNAFINLKKAFDTWITLHFCAHRICFILKSPFLFTVLNLGADCCFFMHVFIPDLKSTRILWSIVVVLPFRA